MNQSDLHGAVTFSFGGIFAWQMYVAIDARDLSGPYTVRCCISLLCDVIVTLIDYTLNLFHLFLMIIFTIIIIIYYYYYHYYYYYCLIIAYNIIYLPGIYPICII